MFSPEQQEAFAAVVRAQLRRLDLTREEAAERGGIHRMHMGTLSRTAPTGLSYVVFLKACLILDLDLYEVCTLLGLDHEVRAAMRDHLTHYPNTRFHLQPFRSLDARVASLPTEKREKAKEMIDAVLRNV